MFTRSLRQKRKGNILVLSAVMMIVMVGMLAFAIDLGYLCLAKDELQRSADAAAIAAAWELIDEDVLSGSGDPYVLETSARSSASQFAGLNEVLRDSPGLSSEDVAVGYLADPTSPTTQLVLDGENAPNAVRVRVRRTVNQNGEVPFFLARVLGLDSAGAQAEATAALMIGFRGFQTPGDGGCVDILPFALDHETWCDMLGGIGDDTCAWNAETESVESGSDGILEVNLYPQGIDSPGNRGTVDIGSSNNSTADIARQIVDGISPEDLEHHGGSLELDCNDQLSLNGDTGISAGVKDELASIVGQRRIIPIFSDVTNPGDNAQYTIVTFAGIRIMEVKLTGAPSQKRVIIQPACIVARGGIPAPGSESSYFVYSPVWLVR